MRLDEQLMAFPVPVGEQEMSPRDAMLYSLGIGIGNDPLDKGQLQFVYEKDLSVFHGTDRGREQQSGFT